MILRYDVEAIICGHDIRTTYEVGKLSKSEYRTNMPQHKQGVIKQIK